MVLRSCVIWLIFVVMMNKFVVVWDECREVRLKVVLVLGNFGGGGGMRREVVCCCCYG